MPYLSALEVCSGRSAIQIQVYLYLYLYLCDNDDDDDDNVLQHAEDKRKSPKADKKRHAAAATLPTPVCTDFFICYFYAPYINYLPSSFTLSI